MNTTPIVITFTLEGGATLIVAAGTRYDIVGRREARQAWPAEDELIRVREHESRLLHGINALRAVHGKDPIT